ncbi:hypothetical protein FZEAL_10085 [Fusarium zealandicum]|uniref:Glycosyltransferase 2-like domain-containing protein n=1 Tax=Fusarium zealandicum TaxID=1053134 RepID=A0A8H4XDD4_9HYPO|nr:hypothetical protein FZEAL_10085 [Fusarium zealandicum]
MADLGNQSLISSSETTNTHQQPGQRQDMDSSSRPASTAKGLPTSSYQGAEPARPSYPSSPFRPISDHLLSAPNSRAVSRASSLYDNPMDDPSLVAKYVSRRATLLGFFEDPEGRSLASGHSETCIAVKTPDDNYVFQPSDINPMLALAVARLEAKAVLSMTSDAILAIIDSLQHHQTELFVEATGARISIASSLEAIRPDLAVNSKACLVVRERVMLVWSSNPRTIVNVAHDTETQLLGLSFSPSPTPNILSRRSSFTKYSNRPQTGSVVVRGAIDEKNEIYKKAVALEEGVEEGDDGIDVEGNAPRRPTLYLHALKMGFTIMLVIITQSISLSKLLNQYYWDGGKLRFTLVATMPALAVFSLFFFSSIVTGFFQLLLPVSPCQKNSKFHSAVKPNAKRYRDYELPHITIQMPVYKEGLKGYVNISMDSSVISDSSSVIAPTMVSVMAAIQYYEERGGTASVFINDDGMQCIQPELAEARRQYYRENGIGYTARLPHAKQQNKGSWFSWFNKSDAPQDNEQEKGSLSPQDLSNKIGFERKGKFKKASNMNYGLAFSNRVEDEMSRLSGLECEKRGCAEADLTVEDDDEVYGQALQNILGEDEGRTWAEGNIRIGELILIIDCDTRVPIDCLLYGALEMHESPEVAILQHASGVMQVVHNTFENGITYFTNVIYTAIKYGCGQGDIAPFVGHNAFLRWKAVQSVAFVDTDGKTKWWSESHVSEDFDIALRIQVAGMTCRLASYDNGEFKEGVSLTLYDELTRWEKYSYGSNELLFNPFYQWIYKGPVTRVFLRFLWSDIPVTSKATIIAYMFTYHAISAGMFLTVVNYFVIGLFPDVVDHYYTSSFGIWVGLAVVFNAFGSVAFAMLRHKLKEATFWRALAEALKWVPFLALFFGGISINCAKALLCHAFSINIEWSSTAKEVGPTGFYIGLGKMIKTFRYTWGICLILAAVIIYMAVGAPWGWTITPGPHSTATIAIIPLALQIGCAFFLPFFLGVN